MASQFPGMDEVIRYLQEQNALEQAAARKAQTVPNISGQAPKSKVNLGARQQPAIAGPSRPGQVAPSFTGGKGGVYNVAPGSGGAFARRALGSAMVAAPFIPMAIDAGEGLGHMYNRLRGAADTEGEYLDPNSREARAVYRQANSGKYANRLPSLTELGVENKATDIGVIPRTEERQQRQLTGYLPAELEYLRQEQAQTEQPITVPISDSNSEGADAEVESIEEIPPEMLIEAKDARLEDLLAKEDRPAPRVEEFPESRSTLAALGKNKVGTPPVRRETPKRGFLGHVGEFFRTGGRNRELDDYNRELEVYQKANQFTDPEKLSAGVAEKDVFSARDINARGELARYSGEGMSQQDKFMADLLSSEQKIGMAGKASAEKDAREHGYRMTEIGASAANQKLTPEAAKSQTAYKIMTEYPDIFTPEQIAAVTGVAPTEEGLSNLSKGRARDDGTAKTLQTMALLQALKGGGPTPTTTKGVKEDAKKKVQVKDKSMLETKKE
jgi:hypothetical protein